MKLIIFSIRDNVAEIFNKPFTDLTPASAMRAFSRSLKEEPQKGDYTLYRIGSFDQINGTITADNNPVQIMTGFEVQKEEDTHIDENQLDMLRTNAS